MFKRKAEDEEGEQPKIIELKVLKSRIKVPGSCRINDAALERIRSEEKDQVAIHFDGATILCTVFADDLIEKDLINLRADDLKKLNVRKGETVSLGSRKDMKKHLKLMKKMEKAEKKMKEELQK